MPTKPSAIQSHGTAETFRLRNGRVTELRCGCLVDAKTRHSITSSKETRDYLLNNAELSDDQRIWWQAFGNDVCRAMSVQNGHGAAGLGMPRSNRIKQRMEAAQC